MFLGIIEGFYGMPWSWKARIEYADFIKSIGFNFYIYAPKDDKYFRENWKEPIPRDKREKLVNLSNIYHKKGIKWGVGFSPYNAYISYNNSTKRKLKAKLEEIALLNPDIIAILFDDMKGNVKNIAKTQIEIVHFILENTKALKILFCPTYYSFDPILDNFFGQRPEDYLNYIGKNIDPVVDIIWTGPMVRSESITSEHLKYVTEILKCKPFIWDNFIANDGKKHKQYLYIKPFKSRNRDILKHISGFMINPMNQAYLSQIPIMTLADELGTLNRSYQQSETEYRPEDSIRNAIEKVCGSTYVEKILQYINEFLKGLNNVSEKRKSEMLEYFSSINEKWALEIVEWLEEDL